MDARTEGLTIDPARNEADEPALLRQMKAYWNDAGSGLDVALGRDIGYEFARLGMKLPDDSPAPVEEGFAEGKHAYTRFHEPSERYERKLVRLRLSAYKRNRVIDPMITPAFLASIDVKYCPITRIELTSGMAAPTDATVDRVFNGGGYAIGNLAIMSMAANQAKGSLMPREILEIAASGESRGGLDPIEWMRLACLTALAAPPGYPTNNLPLYVFPPNGILLTNGYTLVQACATSIAAGYLQQRWEAELRKGLAGKHAKKLFDGFMEALIGRVSRAVCGVHDPELRRFALCDCWTAELVFARYERLIQGISKADMAALVKVATRAQQSVRRTSVTELERKMTPDVIEASWGLRNRGYMETQ